MSFVEDARKLLQDFVAPELRGINQRLDDLVAGLEKSFASVERLAQERQKAFQAFMAERLQASEKVTAERLQASGKLAAERQNALLDRMEAMKRELLMAVDLAIAHRRIEELEGRQQRQTQPASGQTRA